MKIKNLSLLLVAAMLCVFTIVGNCQQKTLAQGVATLAPGNYDGSNIVTFYSHVTVSTRAAGPTGSVGYSLTSCGTTKPESVGALSVGKIVPGKSFEILSLSGDDTSTVCWVIYKLR
jgi:hypothetical protein